MTAIAPLKPFRTLVGVIVLLSFGICSSCARKPTSEPAPVEAKLTKEKPVYTLPGLSHGLLQSPVNILTDHAGNGDHVVALNLHNAEAKYLRNKGSTIELEFPAGSSITFDGREYELQQIHFHTPSEHQIDGVTYPMELHAVNMIEPKNPNDPPLYLVVSLLYKMGKEDELIASFLDQIPSKEGRGELEPGRVYLAPGKRDRDLHYYHYKGSLTTPPYTETVDWLVGKEILEASPEQIRRINLVEGDNARRVQALYGRQVD